MYAKLAPLLACTGICLTLINNKEKCMITLYHLGVSQSDRIVWLLEELGLPYTLEWFDRGPDNLAPPAFTALHPAATAPIIKDGNTTLAESVAICEYLCWRHADGKLSVAPAQDNYPDYLYWMQVNNALMAVFFAKMAGGEQGISNPVIASSVTRREKGYFDFIEQRLGEVPYLAGDEFTCADIMIMFNLTTLPMFSGKTVTFGPNTQAYINRVTDRPAYKKAMAIAGPAARRP